MIDVSQRMVQLRLMGMIIRMGVVERRPLQEILPVYESISTLMCDSRSSECQS